LEHLDRYLSSPPPGYALLLTGEWGVGKTYLWRLYAESLGRFGLIPITISVAGLSSLEELDRAVLQATISRIGDMPIREASSAIGRSLLRTINIDPDDLRLKADLVSGKTVVCIDDLERFAGDLGVLFGFVMDLIERADVHCILIADESRASEKFEDFAETRERVIGKSVRLVPNIRRFVEQTVRELPKGSKRPILLENIELIVEMVQAAKIVNLRMVRYLITEIESVLRQVVPHAKAGAHFGRLFEAIAFWAMAASRDAVSEQLAALAFKSPDLAISFEIAEVRELEGDEADVIKIRRLLEDFGMEERALLWPGSAQLVALVEGRKVDYPELAREFGLTVERPSEDPLKELGRFRLLPDARVQELAESMRQGVVDGRVLSLGRIFETFRTLLFLSSLDVITIRSEELYLQFRDAIAGLDPVAADGHVDFLFGAYNEFERQIIGQLSAVAAKAGEVSAAQRKLELRAALLRGEAASLAADLFPIFEDADAAVFLHELQVGPKSAVVAANALFRRRLRIEGMQKQVGGDLRFARALAAMLREQVERKRPMPVRNVALLELEATLEKFVASFEPGARAH
jgi:hypothetical protein